MGLFGFVFSVMYGLDDCVLNYFCLLVLVIVLIV